jgi:hypothetical protein
MNKKSHPLPGGHSFVLLNVSINKKPFFFSQVVQYETAHFISDSILNPSGWRLFAGGFASLIDHLILLFIPAGEDTAKQRKQVESY